MYENKQLVFVCFFLFLVGFKFISIRIHQSVLILLPLPQAHCGEHINDINSVPLLSSQTPHCVRSCILPRISMKVASDQLATKFCFIFPPLYIARG